jgi:hypothetical protein
MDEFVLSAALAVFFRTKKIWQETCIKIEALLRKMMPVALATKEVWHEKRSVTATKEIGSSSKST